VPAGLPLLADLPGIGTYTITLVESDFKENAGNTSFQRHVLVWGGNAFGDNRIFSLNGIPAGTEELGTELEILDNIIIEWDH